MIVDQKLPHSHFAWLNDLIHRSGAQSSKSLGDLQVWCCVFPFLKHFTVFLCSFFSFFTIHTYTAYANAEDTWTIPFYVQHSSDKTIGVAFVKLLSTHVHV